jgi:Protein of unknown function (DUF3703)
LLLMNLRSPEPMRRKINDERTAARNAFHAGQNGWAHLERAHILSQPWAFDHMTVHASMLAQAWRDSDNVEVRGQLVRLLVAGPGSATRRYPIGNTGRARVPATSPMTIPDGDLRTALLRSEQPVD